MTREEVWLRFFEAGVRAVVANGAPSGGVEAIAETADRILAEFDKRFPLVKDDEDDKGLTDISIKGPSDSAYWYADKKEREV